VSVRSDSVAKALRILELASDPTVDDAHVRLYGNEITYGESKRGELWERAFALADLGLDAWAIARELAK
jgi:hypothetical protein